MLSELMNQKGFLLGIYLFLGGACDCTAYNPMLVFGRGNAIASLEVNSTGRKKESSYSHDIWS
jgi:hypothetical protein